MERDLGSQSVKVSSTLTRTLPSDEEIRALREAIEDGRIEVEEVGDAKLPAVVRKVVEAARDKGAARLRAVAFPLGGRAYFLVEAEDRGGGSTAQVFTPLGDRVTGCASAASGYRVWDSSPAEALRERTLEAFVARTFKASKLGTSALKPFEVQPGALPPKLMELAADNKADNQLSFYRLQVYGETFYAEFCRYAPTNPNSAREIGSFTLLSAEGEFIGCEFLARGGPETLKIRLKMPSRRRG
jgi:hypothetical protein